MDIDPNLLAMSYDCGTKDKYHIRSLSSKNYNKSIQAAAYFIQSTKGCILAEKFKSGAITILGINSFVEERTKKTNKGIRILVICNKDKIESWKRKFQVHGTIKYKYKEVPKSDLTDKEIKIEDNIVVLCPWSILAKQDKIKEHTWDVLICGNAEKCGGAELEKPSKQGVFVCGNEALQEKPLLARKKIFIVDVVRLFKRGPLPLYPIMRACLPRINITRTEFINRYCAPEWQSTFKKGDYKHYIKENKKKDDLAFLELQWLLRSNGTIRRMQKDLRASWLEDVDKETLQKLFNLRKGRTKIMKEIMESPLFEVELYKPGDEMGIIDETK